MSMLKNISRRVLFKGVSVATLFDLYLDAKKHAAAIGAPVHMQNKEGSRFRGHGEYIRERNLQLVKNRLIVQSWRGSDCDKSTSDSTFILLFEQEGSHAVTHMTHGEVPDEMMQDIKQGWKTFYWEPWKKYLKGQA
jgi:activator of HSP90 ATPase